MDERRRRKPISKAALFKSQRRDCCYVCSGVCRQRGRDHLLPPRHKVFVAGRRRSGRAGRGTQSGGFRGS